MYEKTPQLDEIVLKTAELSQLVCAHVPQARGTFMVQVTNHGDFNLELHNEDDSEGGYAPTHNELKDCLEFILYDPSDTTPRISDSGDYPTSRFA